MIKKMLNKQFGKWKTFNFRSGLLASETAPGYPKKKGQPTLCCRHTTLHSNPTQEGTSKRAGAFLTIAA